MTSIPRRCFIPPLPFRRIGAALFISLLVVDSLIAQEPLSALKTSAGTGTPWRISADRITYNRNTGVYTATGDVRIHKDGNTLSADTIRYDQTTREAFAQGNVTLTAGQDRIDGDEVQINLETGAGIIHKGHVFIEKNHFYITGDQIRKTGESTYEIQNASLTACDGDRPDWRITSRFLDVTVEGYGFATHSALNVRDVPVFYTPWAVFPVKLKRQTGLLAPQVGYSSRLGVEACQPFFWAISQDADATVYYHHLSERGEKIGGEFRYALSRNSRGTLMADTLNDRKTDADGGDWGYPDDAYPRNNHDRYWVRGKLDQSLPLDVKMRADVDVASDQDYLKDFSDGYTGFDETRSYFNRQFGRDLDDDTDWVRENSLNFQRTWTAFSLNGGMRWYDDVVKRREGGENDTLQQLPGVSLDAIRQPLWRDRLFWGMDTEYAHFYRQDGDTGQRVDLHPRLYLPLRFGRFAAFEPSVGFRQTAWQTNPEALESENQENKVDGATPQDTQHRELYDLRADLSTDLFRVFDVQGKRIEKIKHTLTPGLTYSYTPDQDQAELPFFTGEDRIYPENQLAFSLTQYLTAKNQNAAQPRETGMKEETPSPYHQWLRFRLSQPYSFLEETRLTQDQPPVREHVLPLYGELDAAPFPALTLHSDGEWGHEESRFLSHNVNARLTAVRGDFIQAEHRYARDESQSVRLDWMGVATQAIRLFGDYERNIEDGESIQTTVGCRYQAQCWWVEVALKDETNDRKIGFMIGLSGIAEMGNSR